MNRVFSLSFDELVELTLQNNTEILSAQNSYDTACLSLQTLNGAYAPQVSFSSSTTLPDEYKWDTTPDYFSSSITYSQPIPGGMTINLTGGASFNAADILEERFLSQNPDISISLSQSLLPYWVQGKLKNPVNLTANQQKEYYYNQLLYTKKTVLQNLVQNYIYAAIYKKQIQIYKNLITLLEEQKELSKQLLKTGATNQAKITELQSSKLSYQQDLISAQLNFFNCLQNMKTICGNDFELDISMYEKMSFPSLDHLINEILLITNNISDPLEKSYRLKIEILETNRTLEKQSSAPTLSFSIQPTWSFELKKQNEWKDAWKDLDSPSSWTAMISVDLSPLLSASVNKKKKQYELNYETAENIYNAYITQKSFLLEQYKSILDEYKAQLKEITNLYNTECLELQDLETQYIIGAISKLDFDSVKVRVENCGLNVEIIEFYVWLYEFLYNTNL